MAQSLNLVGCQGGSSEADPPDPEDATGDLSRHKGFDSERLVSVPKYSRITQGGEGDG